MEPSKGHQAMELSKGNQTLELSIGHRIRIFLHLLFFPSLEKANSDHLGPFFPDITFEFKSW
jgi:hypothetical protein